VEPQCVLTSRNPVQRLRLPSVFCGTQRHQNTVARQRPGTAGQQVPALPPLITMSQAVSAAVSMEPGYRQNHTIAQAAGLLLLHRQPAPPQAPGQHSTIAPGSRLPGFFSSSFILPRQPVCQGRQSSFFPPANVPLTTRLQTIRLSTVQHLTVHRGKMSAIDILHMNLFRTKQLLPYIQSHTNLPPNRIGEGQLSETPSILLPLFFQALRLTSRRSLLEAEGSLPAIFLQQH